MEDNYGIIRVVKDLLTGKLRFAPEELQEERLSICEECEAQNHALRLCTVCGCSIPLKVRLRDSSCPMELWGALKDSDEK